MCTNRFDDDTNKFLRPYTKVDAEDVTNYGQEIEQESNDNDMIIKLLKLS